MESTKKALPHLLTTLAVIAAMVILAVDHVIAGGEAYGGILVAGGFTLGGTIASGSISTAATAAVDVSRSASQVMETHSQTQSTQSQPANQSLPTPPTSV